MFCRKKEGKQVKSSDLRGTNKRFITISGIKKKKRDREAVRCKRSMEEKKA